ncbi:hypothetical protein HMF8227_00078 [Saliniradius amylolyticus]|uniref:SURF1-like protein n=1 Tax=Saliniradius amylolyticus TaxID=2183582 RepID=A0A2S2DYY3_9ALTE|nr:SURF1 family protein [Saliniradius amylolyticus]AWL10586.1 hypothetical protein HMF8227_00078 [Saliniradius amylolyticus]
MKLSALPIRALVVTLVAVAILLRLGFWQLERAEQKRLRAEQLAEREQTTPLSLEDVSKLNGDIRDYPLQVRGALLKGRLIYWDNRVLDGQVGYEVIVPMVTDDKTLLVNLGWLAAPAYRDQLPDVSVPQGVVSLKGVITQPSGSPLSREMGQDSGWPLRVQQPNISRLEELLERPLMNFIVQAGEPERFGLASNWRPVTMPAQKHVGYAVQWFGLALAAVVIFIVAWRKRHQSKR